MKLLVRNDGLTNDSNGMGGASDGFATSKYGFLHELNSFQLNKLYKYNGLLKKIIDLPSSDTTRNWITIENDTDKEVVSYLKKINAKLHLTNALKITRLHGSGLVVLNINDGEEDISKPVNIGRVNDVSISHVFTPSQFQPVFETTNILNYEKYRIFTSNGIGVGGLEIHKSRTLLLTNNPLFTDPINKFGDSTVFEVLSAVKRLDYVDNIITKLMEISQYDIIEIDKEELENLAENGKTSDEIGKIIKAKLESLNKAKSVYNTMAISSGDSITRMQSNFANYDNLITKFEGRVSSVSNIPVHILFGTEKSGSLSKAGDSELESYYNFVGGIQETILSPAISELLTLISYGLKIPTPSFVFNALWQESEQEYIDRQYKQAQIDKIYIDAGDTSVATSILQSRFGGNGYSFETQINTKEIQKSTALDRVFDDPTISIKKDGCFGKFFK